MGTDFHQFSNPDQFARGVLLSVLWRARWWVSCCGCVIFMFPDRYSALCYLKISWHNFFFVSWVARTRGESREWLRAPENVRKWICRDRKTSHCFLKELFNESRVKVFLLLFSFFSFVCRTWRTSVCTGVAGHDCLFCYNCYLSSAVWDQDVCRLNDTEADIFRWAWAYS